MNWKEYYMNIAKAVALKSKDPNTKVGSIIIDKDNKIVSTGFNGFVAGCDENIMTYQKPMKYFTIIHAELNSLIFARRDVTGCVVYTTHFPCTECLKNLLQAGIREIYYDDIGIYHRTSDESKEAIARLVIATKAKIESINGISFIGGVYAKEIK